MFEFPENEMFQHSIFIVNCSIIINVLLLVKPYAVKPSVPYFYFFLLVQKYSKRRNIVSYQNMFYDNLKKYYININIITVHIYRMTHVTGTVLIIA